MANTTTLKERDVVLVGKDADNNTTIDYPLTRVAQIEDLILPLPINQGGTGATTLQQAQKALNVLPLTGGTLSGNVSFKNKENFYVTEPDDSCIVTLIAGKTSQNDVSLRGASLNLYGGLYSTDNKGCFSLSAATSDKVCYFKGTPNGTLTWLGKEIERVDAINKQSNFYIKYNSGFQLVVVKGNITSKSTLTFPHPFSTACSVVIPYHYNNSDTNNANVTVEVVSFSKTNVTLRTNSTSTHTFNVIAIGY